MARDGERNIPEPEAQCPSIPAESGASGEHQGSHILPRGPETIKQALRPPGSPGAPRLAEVEIEVLDLTQSACSQVA